MFRIFDWRGDGVIVMCIEGVCVGLGADRGRENITQVGIPMERFRPFFLKIWPVQTRCGSSSGKFL